MILLRGFKQCYADKQIFFPQRQATHTKWNSDRGFLCIRSLKTRSGGDVRIPTLKHILTQLRLVAFTGRFICTRRSNQIYLDVEMSGI